MEVVRIFMFSKSKGNMMNKQKNKIYSFKAFVIILHTFLLVISS